MSDFAVRRATLLDLDRMRALNIACLPENYGRVFWKQQFDLGAPHFVAYRCSTLLSQPMSRTIVGYIATLPTSLGNLMVYSLAVRPEVRGRGIGDQLLQTLCEEADEMGRDLVLHVRTDNAVAMGLYQKQGFEVKETVAHYYGDGSGANEMVRKKKNKSY
jgi:ribosomal protein S18 acetylase RimI-like enzyme